MQGISTVTTKGQVLIPANIRKLLGIKPADRVVFDHSDESITIKKAPTIASMYGYIKSNKHFSDAELEHAIEQAVTAGVTEKL
jgi:AbrB family looped-hinge helix DNA binding protein